MTDSTARAERIKPQSATAPGYLWEVAQKPVSVHWPYGLIDRLEKEVVDNFRSLSSPGSEIGGILLGSTLPGNPILVSVDDFELVTCDYSRGPLYRLSDADMGRFEYAIQQRQSGSGLTVIGFFRSHTRKGLALDAEDIAFLDARFREAYQIGLLVRPYATKPSTAGIFIREGGSILGESSYLEFPFRSSQLSSYRPLSVASPAAESPAPLPAAAPPSSASAVPQPAAPKPPARAQIVPIASRREINLPAPPPPQEPARETAAPVEAAAPAVTAPPAPAPVASASVEAPVKPEPPKAEPETPKVEAAAPVAPPQPVKPAAIEKEVKKPTAEVKLPVQPEAKKPEVAPVVTPEPEKEKSKTPLIAGVVAVIALILVGLFVYPGFLKHGSIPVGSDSASSISLRVERTGTDILLTWNRDSASIRNASRAVLYIFDGDRHENYDMDLGQLRNGSIVYSPITADVSFRMDVTRQGKSTPVSESVRFLRTRPSPMGDDSQNPGSSAAKPSPTQPNQPNQPAPGATAAPAKPDASDAAETPAPEDSKPAVSVSPARPFDTSSLSQRLRPATQQDLLEAPSITPGVATPSAPTSIPGLNLNGPAPAPGSPVAPAPDRKASTGGQIKTAELVFRKEPEYPKLARQMGVKGIVELTATIGADGKVKGVKVDKGHPLLTKAATDAVMQWVYRPTLLNGQPVQNDTKITLNFMGER